MNKIRLNRIKAVLAEKNKTGKWLAESLGVSCITVSKWCTNTSQPSLLVLTNIAGCLKVNVKDLINE